MSELGILGIILVIYALHDWKLQGFDLYTLILFLSGLYGVTLGLVEKFL